ncbi:ABC transporter permease subunit [Ruegeria sp.]|uniref:amino acid ABC transporter permease n=1 Tax=Ruegeria sp. TaxID=1879320 RepID=UPI00232531A3|nr:ABC transporter permease subunit [Ruegeria sp.]MDA7965676.1 ABC transporter permease subunit [Ruegeria sp.]
MSTMTDPPKADFRLSMLINDTRYRSLTFQVIAAVAIALSIWYLGNNLIQNLRAAGLNISYSFLGDPAGYDINQRLIEYDSQSSHARAAIVGILNTLLVAVLACITATFFGVFAGVLRLSNNWLVSKLMAIYVEIFRNIPVLIWILIIFFIVTAAMPAPRAYLGEQAERDLVLGLFAFTNRGIYVPSPFFTNGFGAEGGSAVNWLVVIAVLILSHFATRFVNKNAQIKQEQTGNRPNTLLLNGLIWLVPLVAVLFILGLSWDFPDPLANRFNLRGGLQIGAPLIALWFALSIYTGAFIAENVRAGIQAINKGQTEAAAALGLRQGRIMNLVILPQALRVIIPPLISQYLNITKNSSLAIAVGYADITATLGGITLNQTGRAIECVLLMMLFYLTASLLISTGMNIYNASVKLKER